MKRKVLQVGRSSLAISLPKEYVETNLIESGQEMDVTVHGASVIVRCDEPRSKKKHVDITGLSVSDDNRKLLDKVLGALFKQGADSFAIRYEHPEHAQLIRAILQKGKVNLYEEPSSSDEKIITIHSSIKNYDQTQLELLLGSTLKQIYRQFDEYIQHVKKKTLTGEIRQDLIRQDSLVNNQVDICKRIINKDVLNFSSTTTYSFVDKIEKIGDAVKDLIETVEPDLCRENSSILISIRDFFNMTYLANCNFTIKRIGDFYTARSDIRETLGSVKDPALFHHCQRIVELIQDSFSDIMTRDI